MHYIFFLQKFKKYLSRIKSLSPTPHLLPLLLPDVILWSHIFMDLLTYVCTYPCALPFFPISEIILYVIL